MIYAVAMSGGVDSSVAAYLLKKEGHQVFGFTMCHFDDTSLPFKLNSISKAIEDARSVCNRLDIEHFVIDLKKEFNDIIINDFIKQYQAGFTPNPCILCNPTIKWGLFPQGIAKIISEKTRQSDFIMATGHYAQKKMIDGHPALFRPIDKRKDQTYMLWKLNQDQLNQTVFPLSQYTKDEIRVIAQNIGLEVAEKKDSQDICFIENNYSDFLMAFMKSSPGDILFHDGRVIGKHHGLIHYTIGQRKGLVPWSKPLFVKEIKAEENQVIVTDEGERLDSQKFSVVDLNFIREEFPFELKDLKVKVRYNSPEDDIEKMASFNQGLIIELKYPVRAITPGQSAVFYRNDELIGGGIIDKVF